MEKEIAVKIDINADTGARSLSELKKEFKETQKELEGLRSGSEEYIKTLQKLGGIRDDIGDLNDEINAFNPQGKIQAFGNVIGGLASGFQAAQGAAALFGAEGEALQATLLKVQAASAFADGIKGVMGMSDAFKVLGSVIKANPISAVVTALSALASVAVMVYNSIDRTSESTKSLNKELEKQKAVTISLTKESSRQIELLTAQGASEREIIAVKEKLTKAQLLEIATSIRLHISKVQDIQDNDSIYESALRVQKTIYEKVGALKAAEAIELQIQLNKKERSQEDLDAIQKEKEDLADLQNQIQVFSAQKIELDKKESKAHQDELEKRKEEERKFRQYVNDISKQLAAVQEADRKAIEAQKDKEVEEETQRILNGLSARRELIMLHNAETFQGQLENLQIQRDAELANVELTESEKLLIKEKYAKQESELKQQQFQQELEGYQQLAAATQAITDLVFTHQLNQAQGNAKKEREIRKRQFKVNKAFGIANSIIDGVQAVQKALNNPYPLNLILAIASGILATANTVKIAATKFDDGGGDVGVGGGASLGSLGSAGGGITLAPPSTGSTQLNPDGTVKNENLNKQPVVKAVVVETDITKTQKRINSIEERASL